MISIPTKIKKKIPRLLAISFEIPFSSNFELFLSTSSSSLEDEPNMPPMIALVSNSFKLTKFEIVSQKS